MPQRNLNGYRWAPSDWNAQHGGSRERQNYYWNQRNDAAFGDDRYVNMTRKEDIAGSWDEASIDSDRKNFSGVGPRNYRRPDESVLDDLHRALQAAPDVDASEVEVFVNKGVVTLRGTVGDRRMKRRIETYADRVSGVIDVMNELQAQSRA